MTVEKVEIRNRWTGNIQFTAEIEAPSWMGVRGKIGLAVKWAIGNGADLSGADLSGADLSGADLSGADLSGVDLNGAVLNGAVLRSFKADFFLTLLQAQAEVPAMIAALREGRVNGSQYEGDCACLVGTLANARGADYRVAFPDRNSRNPAEQWFLMINKGDKPGDDTGGGFAAEKALEWALEFCALTGIAVEDPAPPTSEEGIA